MEDEYIKISNTEYAVKAVEVLSIEDMISARDQRLATIAESLENVATLKAQADELTLQIDRFNSLPVEHI